MEQRWYIGVDIGGTAIKVGICNAKGELLHRFEGPTEASKGADHLVDNIVSYVRRIIEQADYKWEDVAGVGVGMAGFLDIPNGFVKLSPNIGLRDFPLQENLEAKLGINVKINNDANVAALGEAWSGAGAGRDHIVCLTLGTGVGGGVIIDGKIYQGFSGVAGELGHMAVVPDLEAVQCGCGQMGCLETVSSATGVIRMANDAVERGDKTSLGLLKDITAKDVFDAAKAGDEVAQRIVQRAAHYLGKSIALIAVIINPQRFIFGGGMSRAGDILFDAIKENFNTYTSDIVRDGVDIVPAVLGNDAGVIGAAGLNLR